MQMVDAIFNVQEIEYYICNTNMKLIHKKHNDYKKELNDWLDHIFERDNKYFLSSQRI